MRSEDPKGLEHIEADVKSQLVCSNLNRVSILHLLKGCDNNEMQAEEMSFRLGLSHRTVLYHLDILHDYGLVEVRKFLRRGNKMIRSVWGLQKNHASLKKVFSNISESFDQEVLDRKISTNSAHQ